MRKLFPVILLLSITLCAQESYIHERNNVVPISPNAASLGIYGSIPVGNYTGTTNITIPLYEIELDGKKFPMTLSYNGSGVKVAQEASWVGLGWNLSVGGCIIKEVKGWDDFSSSPLGYYNNTNFPHPNSSNDLDINYSAQDLYSVDCILSNFYDGEPDLFHYNFAGFSGTCFFKQGNPKAIQKDKKQYLNIIFNPTSKSWVINDGDGYTYYFSKKENSVMYNSSYENFRKPCDETLGYLMRDIQPDVITAWHLDSIISPYKNKIEFTYEVEQIKTSLNVSEEKIYKEFWLGGYPVDYEDNEWFLGGLGTWLPDEGGYAGCFLNPMPPVLTFYNYSYSIISQQRLKKIKWSSGEIEFVPSNRYDIKSNNENVALAKKLERIEIKSINDCRIKTIKFAYMYNGSTNSPNTCRLMLNSVCETDSTLTNDINKYKFIYNNGELPPKDSFQEDFWGYYNGQDFPENSFLKFTPSIIAGKSFYSGKDLSPNEELMKYGVLTEIIYPTGAKSIFKYSPNSFSNSFKCSIDYLIREWLFYEQVSSPIGSRTIYFTVDTMGVYDFDLFYTWDSESMMDDQHILAHVDKIENNNYTNIASLGFDCFDNIRNSGNSGLFMLHPGNYRFVLNKMVNSNNDCNARAKLNEYKIKTQSFGAGLKVDEIIVKNNDDTLSVKKYNYKKNGQTSGLLMVVPDYYRGFNYFNEGRAVNPVWGSTISESGSFYNDTFNEYTNFFNVSSIPYTPFSLSANGCNVGYSYVEETHRQNDSIGKTIYEYHSNPNKITHMFDRFLIGLPSIQDINNGNLLKMEMRNNDGNIVKNVTNEYNTLKLDSIKGVKTYRPPTDNCLKNVKFYDVYSNVVLLNETRTVEYFNSGTDSVTTYNDYTYSSENMMLLNEKTYDNNETDFQNSYKYSFNFEDSTYVGLKNNHMLNFPVEVIKRNNNNVVYANKITYRDDILKLFLPDIQYEFNSIHPMNLNNYFQNYMPVIKFEKYNAKGKLTQVRSLLDNIPITYIWSYNNQYPVAEIKNATLNQVSDALTGTTPDLLANLIIPDMQKVEALRQHPDLSNAQITTYTYKPLVGMTSKTDPRGVTTFYEYDDFNRLKCIKDNQGNVIQKFDYHYKE